MVPDTEVKEVQIDPPNIRTGPIKKGNIDGILFSKPSYTAIGNPFQEAALTLVRKEDRARQIEIGNEKAFRPAKHVRKDLYKASFEHMKDFEIV